MMLINPYRFAAPAGLLLDTYTGAAAAYSLRKLRTAYTGYCIEVRRSSDDTTANIGFVNDVLDESSLTTFCGAGDGFVKTWYDQSGNGNNATNETFSQQPQIVSSGSVLTLNNKPVIKCYGQMLQATRFNCQYPSVFAVLNIYNSSVWDYNCYLWMDGAPSNYGFAIASGYRSKWTSMFIRSYDGNMNYNYTTDGAIRYEQKTVPTGQYLESWIYSGTGSATLNENGSPITTSTARLLDDSTYSVVPYLCLGIMKFKYALSTIEGVNYLQEIVIYPSDQSFDRTSIETNINSFYSIY